MYRVLLLVSCLTLSVANPLSQNANVAAAQMRAKRESLFQPMREERERLKAQGLSKEDIRAQMRAKHMSRFQQMREERERLKEQGLSKEDIRAQLRATHKTLNRGH